jgi:hypothetical protein
MAGLLAIFAEFDREILRERVRAGSAHARENGKRLGRPATAAIDAAEVRRLHRAGVSKSEIARPPLLTHAHRKHTIFLGPNRVICLQQRVFQLAVAIDLHLLLRYGPIFIDFQRDDPKDTRSAHNGHLRISFVRSVSHRRERETDPPLGGQESAKGK